MGQVHFTRESEIAVITIDNPGKLNAFTRSMRLQIIDHLAFAGRDPDIRGVVFTGAGDAFCAGQDLSESMNWDASVPWVAEFETLMRAMLSLPKPVVAAVNGVAAGGGFQVTLLCDSRIGWSGTRMGQPEVKTGLASVTGTWLMQRAVGALRARELALTGRLMDSEELMRLNFLDAIVSREAVLAAAFERCRVFAANPADSFARTKTWMYENLSDELAKVFAEAEEKHRKGFEAGVSQAGAAKFIGNAVTA